MNKKAFTLVELLAVIVVLTILALITIPVISNVVNNVRIKALQSSAYGLIEASQLYYAQYGSSNIRFDINNNQVSSSDTDNLISYKGSIKTGTVILDKKGKVTVCVSDGENSAYKNYNENKVNTVKGKVCNIPSNSSIVYLDDEATIDAYDNAKLTELVNSLQEQINSKPSLDDIYPVGSIYISTTNDSVEDVETRFGGNWEVYAEGKTLVGYKASDNDYTINKEGGNKAITLNSNQIPTLSVNGTTVATTASAAALEAGNHSHQLNRAYGGTSYTLFGAGPKVVDEVFASSGVNIDNPTSQIAGSHTHNVSIPALTVEASYRNDNQTTIDVRDPYITVYMYKRVS